MSHIKRYGSRHSVRALTSAHRGTSAALQLNTDTLDLSIHASLAQAACRREPMRKYKSTWLKPVFHCTETEEVSLKWRYTFK